MTLPSALGAAFLFALACNLDTIPAAVGHGARSRTLSLWDVLLTASLTTAVTYLSLALGSRAALLLPAGAAGQLGALSLLGLGLWYLLDALRGGRSEDARRSGGTLALAAALAVNNAGIGLAAGITGLDPALAAGCNLVLTPLALALGRRLGSRLARKSELALPLSGALLVAMGLWQLARAC